jgi:hypothetical protein
MQDCGGRKKFCNSQDFASIAAGADGRQPDGLNDGGRCRLAYRIFSIIRHISDDVRCANCHRSVRDDCLRSGASRHPRNNGIRQ